MSYMFLGRIPTNIRWCALQFLRIGFRGLGCIYRYPTTYRSAEGLRNQERVVAS